MKKSIVFVAVLAIVLAGYGLSTTKDSAIAKTAENSSEHNMHEQHATSAKPSAVAAQSPSTAAFQAVNDKMHKDMAITFTGNPDKDFLAGMIPHHQGAIDMAEVVLQHGKDPKVRKLAENIIAAQKKEIADMQLWLKEMK